MNLLLLYLFSCTVANTSMPTQEVKKGEFEMLISVNGELEAVKSISITAPDLGRTIKVLKIAEDGSKVNKGDLLVEFEKTEVEDSLEDEQSKHEIATTKIIQKESQLEVQMADLSNAVFRAELDLERSKLRLSDSETIPLVEREGARLDVKQAEVAVERAKKALESARLQGSAELELLKIEARRAKSSVEQELKRLERTTILAPADGLVIKTVTWRGGQNGTVEEGDTVWRGTQLLELPDLALMQVIAWVHEVDAGKVAIGQPVNLVIDAHPDKVHKGKIDKLADLAVPRNGRSKYLKATIALDEMDDLMKPGMTVRAEILLKRLNDVLYIPREAVNYIEGKPQVWVDGALGWGEQDIEVAEHNDTHVVVVSGLEEGDIVALVDPKSWEASE